MYQLEEVHFLVDEMVQNGFIVETYKTEHSACLFTIQKAFIAHSSQRTITVVWQLSYATNDKQGMMQ